MYFKTHILVITTGRFWFHKSKFHTGQWLIHYLIKIFIQGHSGLALEFLTHLVIDMHPCLYTPN